MTGLFSPRSVRRSHRTVARAGAALAAAATAGGGAPVDLQPLALRFSLATIFPAIFGVAVPETGAGGPDLSTAIRTFFATWAFAGPHLLLTFMLPGVLRPVVSRMYSAFDPAARQASAAMDVILATTEQLAGAYLRRHPELSRLPGGWSPPRRPVPIPDLPGMSETSLVAALLHSCNKCAPAAASSANWCFVIISLRCKSTRCRAFLFHPFDVTYRSTGKVWQATPEEYPDV